MPVNPYSSPLKLEYKPLGLEAFAKPLSELSKKFELEEERANLVQDKVGEVDFDIKNLPYGTDPARAKALKEEFAAKRDAIAENLLSTKDYRTAQRDILRLQKEWNKHEEKLGLESNYATFAERDKQEAERVVKGDLSPEEYQEWRKGEIRRFEEAGGTSYKKDEQNPYGTYNTITGKVGRIKNMSKEFDDTKRAIASDIKARKWDSALSRLGIDSLTEDAKYIQKEFEELKPEEIEQKVEQYMQGLERFKPWLKETASYKFDNLLYDNKGQDYLPAAQQLITKNLNQNEAYIKQLEKDKKTDTEDYKIALENRAILQEQFENPDKNMIKGLYVQDYMNKQYDAKALGNIFSINNVKSNYSFRDIPKPDDGTGTDGTKTAGNLPVLTSTIYSPSNVTSIFENISAANSKLFNTVKSTNNVGGIRDTLLRGLTKGSNTGDLYERQVAFRDAVITSKTPAEFKQALNAKGIKVGNELNDLWKKFKSPNSTYMTALNNGINAGEIEYNNLVTGQAQVANLKRSVGEDPDFKAYSAKIGAESPLTNTGIGNNNLGLSPERFISARLKIAGGGNDKTPITKEDKWYATLGKLFDANSYTDEQLKKAGIKRQDIPVNATYNVQYRPLTMNQVAKLKGYKNYADAVLNDYDFGGLPMKTSIEIGEKGLENTYFTKGLSGTPQQITTQFMVHAGRKGLKSEEMAYELLNDPKNQKTLSEHFMTIDNVIRGSAIGSKGFAGLPGFDDEGNPEPETQVLRGEGITPKIVVHNGQISLAVPYKHKDGTGTLTVEPQPGSEGLVSRIIRDNKKRLAKSNDPTDIETYNTLSEAEFGLIYGNDLNDIKANNPANTVYAEKKVLPLKTFYYPDANGNPSKVSIAKVWQGEGVPARFTIRFADGSLLNQDFATVRDLKIAMQQGR